MSTITRYQKRISGLLLDRIDVRFEVPGVEHGKLADDRLGKTSATIRARVEGGTRTTARADGGGGPGGGGGHPAGASGGGDSVSSEGGVVEVVLQLVIDSSAALSSAVGSYR
jgi:hypothetical protein